MQLHFMHTPALRCMNTLHLFSVLIPIKIRIDFKTLLLVNTALNGLSSYRKICKLYTHHNSPEQAVVLEQFFAWHLWISRMKGSFCVCVTCLSNKERAPHSALTVYAVGEVSVCVCVVGVCCGCVCFSICSCDFCWCVFVLCTCIVWSLVSPYVKHIAFTTSLCNALEIRDD